MLTRHHNGATHVRVQIAYFWNTIYLVFHNTRKSRHCKCHRVCFCTVTTHPLSLLATGRTLSSSVSPRLNPSAKVKEKQEYEGERETGVRRWKGHPHRGYNNEVLQDLQLQQAQHTIYSAAHTADTMHRGCKLAVQVDLLIRPDLITAPL